MSLIKRHSKYKNTGILFELLVRQITSDMMTGVESKAVDILKKYYTNTEIAREFNLYSTVMNSQKINESKANTLIGVIVEEGKKLNHEKLNREKFNLIKEIKRHYNVDTFFNAKIQNYKLAAAVYTVLESNYTADYIDPNQIVTNRLTILEHITTENIDNLQEEKKAAEEFMKEDQEVRILAYRILVEKFNEKYSTLSDEQKDILREYIYNVTDTVQLKCYLNTKLEQVKEQILELKEKIDDKVLQIKLNEVINHIKPIGLKQSVKDEHLVSLMQHYELVKEIKTVLG